jgi:hypothetical protein
MNYASCDATALYTVFKDVCPSNGSWSIVASQRSHVNQYLSEELLILMNYMPEFLLVILYTECCTKMHKYTHPQKLLKST